MKNIIINSVIAVFALLMITSCNKNDENRYPHKPAAGLKVHSTGIRGAVSNLDTSVTLRFEVTNINCKRLTVTINPEKKEVVELQELKGELTINLDELGLLTAGDSEKISIVADIESNPEYFYVVRMNSCFQNIDVPTSIASGHDSLYYLSWQIQTSTASVEEVMLYKKLSGDEAYTQIAGSYSAIDSIGISGSEYPEVDADTLYVKIVAKAGIKECFQEVLIPIGAPPDFNVVGPAGK